MIRLCLIGLVLTGIVCVGFYKVTRDMGRPYVGECYRSRLVSPWNKENTIRKIIKRERNWVREEGYDRDISVSQYIQENYEVECANE